MEIKPYKRKLSPIEEIDPSLPPAARSAARKTEGLRRIIKNKKFKELQASGETSKVPGPKRESLS